MFTDINMYLTNKYTKWYEIIIANAKQRVNSESDYFENHHIIPKSLGGSNDSSNLVKLTPKEHYICHLLLTKMVAPNVQHKMWYAHYMMMKGKNRYTPSSRMYELAKTNMRKANKVRPGPNLGKPMAEETKKKISNKLIGKKMPMRSIEHSAKLGQYVRNSEHRDAISRARKAQVGLQKRSEETKKKMSAWQKGIAKPKVKCPHCNKEVSQMNYSRWHGGNCKLSQ